MNECSLPGPEAGHQVLLWSPLRTSRETLCNALHYHPTVYHSHCKTRMGRQAMRLPTRNTFPLVRPTSFSGQPWLVPLSRCEDAPRSTAYRLPNAGRNRSGARRPSAAPRRCTLQLTCLHALRPSRSRQNASSAEPSSALKQQLGRRAFWSDANDRLYRTRCAVCVSTKAMKQCSCALLSAPF